MLEKINFVLKKLFHKLLFVTPLLGLLLSFTHGISTHKFEQDNNVFIAHVNQNTFKNHSFYHEIEEANDYSDFFYEESELENDIELDWFVFNSNLEVYTSSVTENQKLYNKTSFCFIQKTDCLYDLFCNWKHHLS